MSISQILNNRPPSNHPFRSEQLFTYLKLADKQVGLLINFNTRHLRDGIVRIVRNYSGPLPSCPLPRLPPHPQRLSKARPATCVTGS